MALSAARSCSASSAWATRSTNEASLRPGWPGRTTSTGLPRSRSCPSTGRPQARSSTWAPTTPRPSICGRLNASGSRSKGAGCAGRTVDGSGSTPNGSPPSPERSASSAYTGWPSSRRSTWSNRRCASGCDRCVRVWPAALGRFAARAPSQGGAICGVSCARPDVARPPRGPRPASGGPSAASGENHRRNTCVSRTEHT